MSIPTAVIGIFGKMGKSIFQLLQNDDKLELKVGITRKNSSNNNNFLLSDDITSIKSCKVAIDFSTPSTLIPLLKTAKQYKIALVLGTTGFSENDFKLMKKFSKDIPILYSGNFSLGIFILKKLIKAIPQEFFLSSDINILEHHHNEKKDSPSGTALSLKQHLKKNIPIHSIRGGKTIGDHSIFFQWEEENITISHKALTRNVFAKGAISAAKVLVNKKAGFYSLEDLFL